MNGSAPRFARITSGMVVLVAFAWVLAGQAAKPPAHRTPLPTDWSHRHLIFSQPRTAAQAARISRDPRYLQQVQRRSQPLALNAAMTAALGTRMQEFSAAKIHVPNPKKIMGPPMHRDWSQNLGAPTTGTGATVGAGNYPAKFSFDSTTASCTNDYVVFSTELPGTTTQASLVAYNNVYSGCIGGLGPSVLWAYNTSIDASTEKILTSPVLSPDGTQIAFVQTTNSPAGQAGLVLLKWSASSGGTIGVPVQPLKVTAAEYSTCTAPCLTELFLTDGGLAANDSGSSVFYDYAHDTAWVGTDSGYLHKFSPVFNGVPAETNNVNVAGPGAVLSSPVYDDLTHQVFVVDGTGKLSRVDATLGTVTATSNELVFGTQPVQGPVLDASNGLVYVFSAADCNLPACTVGPFSAVYQLSVNFLTATTGTETQVGTGTSAGANPMYIGGFDDAYYTSDNGTGNLYVCGNTGAAPTLYQIPILAGVMPATGTVFTRLTPAADHPACSSVTDVLNPSGSTGIEERLFVSVANNGAATLCGGGGCIMNFLDTRWTGGFGFQLGQQILVKNLGGVLSVETVIQAGGSGLIKPTWPGTAGVQTHDGSVIWINQGPLRATTPLGWVANGTHGIGGRVLDSGGNIEVATVAGTSGAGSAPVWNTTIGGTTIDNTITWINAGPIATYGLAAAGGTSGIIIDNVVGEGTLAGASQVYFSTLSNQVCGTGAGGCAVQASQPALQ